MVATVAVVGGGYGGARAAQLLDAGTDVVLVEAKDAFVHNAAALRGLTNPAWTDRIFMPYDRLLRRGSVVRDRAVRVEPGKVTLRSGAEITADFLVLATGSSYPFPAKMDVDDSASAKDRIHRTRSEVERSGHVLILGAGAVGLELAAEIRTAWPYKQITVSDPGTDVLGGAYSMELRQDLRRQLAAMQVTVRTGDDLGTLPPTEPGLFDPFRLTTARGESLEADLWFRAFGTSPRTEYLAGELSAARLANGRLRVTPQLRVVGQERVFAIGDITDVPEMKQASAADAHAEVVASNIVASIERRRLRSYRLEPPAILVPLGPDGGASELPGGVADAQVTSEYKGKDLMVNDYAEFFGLTAPAAATPEMAL